MTIATQWVIYFGAILGLFLVGVWFADRDAEAAAPADAAKLRDSAILPEPMGLNETESEHARFLRVLRVVENVLQREEEEKQRGRTSHESPPTVPSR